MREINLSVPANTTRLSTLEEKSSRRATHSAELPTVSVVIPCYNYGRFLAQAINSALAQLYPPVEVIVVDDGSNDNTADVARSFGERVRYIHQENRGLSGARNTGIRAAVGEWIAVLDADDIWQKDKLLLQMQFAAANSSVCLIGAQTTHNYHPEKYTELFSIVNTVNLLGALPFGASSAVAKRSALLAAGLFDEAKRNVEDRDMWLKLSLQGDVARVNLPLWTYRFHDGQMINNSKRMADGYLKVLHDFFAAHPQYKIQAPAAYAYCHYDAAVSYFENGSRWRALRHCIKSLWHSIRPLDQRYARNHISRLLLMTRCLTPGFIYDGMLETGKAATQVMRRVGRA
jgi:glycosyltransferase involved in cell wall biosynthesis